MVKLSILGVVGVATLVTSCNLFNKGGEKKEEPKTTMEAQTSPTTVTDVPTPSNQLALTENPLASAWQSACSSTETLNTTSARRTVTMTPQGTFDKVEQFYTEGCDKPQALTYKVAGTYAMLGDNAANPAIKNIDFTVDTASLTVNSATTAELMNSQNFCGRSDWKENMEVDILGKACGGFTVQKGQVVLDVYEVRDNTVYFGQKFSFLSSEDVATRPGAVAVETPYTKS